MATTTSTEVSRAGTATRAPRRPRAGRIERNRQRWGWFFLAPFAAVFLVLLVAPLAYAFWMSLRTDTLAAGESFTGLANYQRAFTDPLFLGGLGRVGLFVAVMVPIQLGVALVAALVLDTLATRLSRFSRLMIFVPYAVPGMIGALMWGFLYSPRFGPATDIFGLFGATPPGFLAPGTVFYSLVNIVTWQWAGYYMIIIYAALRGIDPAVYEAARIDGASGFQIATRIKVPMISAALVMVVIFALIGTLQFFTEPSILRNVAAGAIPVHYTPNMYAHGLAFSYQQFNYASTISFALGVIVFAFSYLFLFLTRKRSGLNS
ncbi:sugar ABC transporter permease [Cellulomonas sp. APG4]|uniref:carbohydrate ABC transporter permease n=1 Tax=Cellulomonas sp. APG4 TaxID=1538656 RepID=UPI00137951EB|nr:sugar ABC transporter permease [Cellulomonas sp. APG4]NCT90466.1 sugar ABC transporter permease [Cellulomonas sp. APG4]